MMYEGGTVVFEVLETAGAVTRLQTPDGALNFWTATSSISRTPPQAAQYDYSVRGRSAAIIVPTIFACAHSEQPTLAFGLCTQLNNVTTATLVARITAGSTMLYLAQIGTGQYLIPTGVVSPSP
jgi:hypothetical protein